MKSENIIPAVSSQVIPIPSNDSIQSDEEELVHSGYFTRSESLPNEIYVPYNNGYKKKKAPFIIGLHFQNILEKHYSTKIINELLTFKKKKVWLEELPLGRPLCARRLQSWSGTTE